MTTKVSILHGNSSERFAIPLQKHLETYQSPVLWTKVPDEEPNLFGNSADAKALRHQYPWLKNAIFAHVLDLKDETSKGSKSLTAAGLALDEAVSFRFIANSISIVTGTVGGEEILQPLPREVDVGVRIERTAGGEVFVFVSGYAGYVENARVQISRVLTGYKMHQLKRYFLSPDEVDNLVTWDVKGKNIGEQYHHKVDSGGSVVVKDTKDSPSMSMIAHLNAKNMRRPKQMEFQSQRINEWITLDGDKASVSWTRTDTDKLLNYARNELVPEVIRMRGNETKPWSSSPFK
ncbi:MAG: hypothetical protein ACYC2H_09505 [Thermoplasmatota archaeon]